MELKDKVNLIDELRNLQEVAEFEQSLEEAPLTEEMVAMLPPKVRNANHQYLQKLREYGQLVKAPVPPIEEFVNKCKFCCICANDNLTDCLLFNK